jgi:hypothetical protein
MQEIKLTLSLVEVNQVLEALGQMPYIQVYELISSIQQQAQPQLNDQQQALGVQRGDTDER